MTIVHQNNKACVLIRGDCCQNAIKLLNQALVTLSEFQHIRNKPAQSFNPPRSQGDNSGNRKVDDCSAQDLHYYPENEYDEGMGTFSQPLFICEQCASIGDNLYRSADEATVLFNLGIAHSRIGMDTEAFAYFQDSLVKQQSIVTTSLNHVDLITAGPSLHSILHNIGHLHHKGGKDADAISSYQKALHLLENDSANDRWFEISSTLNCIAMVKYYANADMNEILPFLERALALRIGHAATNDRGTATIIWNNGRVKLANGECEGALVMYKEAHRQRVATLGENHMDVAAVLFHMAQVEDYQMNVSEAIDLYGRFTSTLIALKRDGEKEMSGALLRIGELFYYNSDLDQAHDFFSRALTSARLAYGPNDHSTVSKILNKIGNILHEQGSYDLALEAYQSGLSSECDLPSEMDGNFAVTLLNIAHIYNCQERWDEAIGVLNEALEIQRRLDDNKNVAITLLNLGLTYQTKGMLDSAVELFEEAVDLFRKMDNGDDICLSSALNALGLVQYYRGSYTLALSSFLEAIEIFSSSGMEERYAHHVIDLYHNLATAYKSIGETDRALTTYQEILQLEQKRLIEDDDESISNNYEKIVFLLCEIGLLHVSGGDLQQALDKLEIASNMCIEHTALIDGMLSYKVFRSLGDVQLQLLGDREMAMESYATARRMYDVESETILGRGHTGIRMNAIEWRLILNAMNTPKAAAAA